MSSGGAPGGGQGESFVLTDHVLDQLAKCPGRTRSGQVELVSLDGTDEAFGGRHRTSVELSDVHRAPSRLHPIRTVRVSGSPRVGDMRNGMAGPRRRITGQVNG